MDLKHVWEARTIERRRYVRCRTCGTFKGLEGVTPCPGRKVLTVAVLPDGRLQLRVRP